MTKHTPIETLDLTRYAFRRTVRDVVIYGTWTLHDKRPCLVLVPARLDTHFNKVTPCIVPLERAYIWDEHTGEPAECAHMAFQFAGALGMNQYEPRNLIFITSLIRDSLDDLLTGIGPYPESEKAVVADVLLHDPNTGKTREAEIKDNV